MGWIDAWTTTAGQALQKAYSPSDRIAARWFSYSYFTIDFSFHDANPHQVALYLMDWAGSIQSETVDILDPNGAILSTQSVSNFSAGIYLIWTLKGHVVIRFTGTNGNYPYPFVNGIFFGGSPGNSIPNPPRFRTGTIANGAYWGAAGEQIDMLSGNLNYSIPLIAAKGRAGFTVPFGLSYNSQIWSNKSGVSSYIGAPDIGYGQGWIIQAGSITQVNGASGYYVFHDATGAGYQLYQEPTSPTLWRPRLGTYVTFDQSSSTLYFPDGSSWQMLSVSAPSEADAGTLYPTLLQDSNGNQISVTYAQGLGGAGMNTSGRILSIADARSNSAYTFSYDGTGHISIISNNIGSTERYLLTFSAPSGGLQDPFQASEFATTVYLLQSLQINVPDAGNNYQKYSFQYQAGYSSGASTGELTKVTVPQGGVLGWGYGNYTYGDGTTLREVQSRTLNSGPVPSALTALANTWSIARGTDGQYGNLNGHSSATVTDSGARSQKVWTFNTNPAAPAFVGLVSSYQEGPSGGAALIQKDYTWAADSWGAVYVNLVKTTLNPGVSQVQSQTAQTLDIYGSVTQLSVYDYGSPTASRTYYYCYAALGSYINNRLSSANVNGANCYDTSNGVRLVSNTYDGASLGNPAGWNGQSYTAHNGSYGTPATGGATGNFVSTRGNLTRSITPGAVRNMTYDIGGVLTEADDNNGHTLSITSSAGSNFALPAAVTPNGPTVPPSTSSALQTTYAYNPAFLLNQVTAPNNVTSSQTYDPNTGQLTQTTSPYGAITSYTFNYSNNTVTATTGVAGNNYNTTRKEVTTYDGFGRTVRYQVFDANQGTTPSRRSTLSTPRAPAHPWVRCNRYPHRTPARHQAGRCTPTMPPAGHSRLLRPTRSARRITSTRETRPLLPIQKGFGRPSSTTSMAT